MRQNSPGLLTWIAGFLRYALLVLWALVCVFPLYWVGVNSLKSYWDVAKGPRYVPFIDFAPQLDAWRYIFFNPEERLVSQFFNSVIDASLATFITMLASGMACYALTRFSFPWPRWHAVGQGTGRANNLIWFLVLASRVLPPVAMLVPIYFLAERRNWLDTHWLIVLLYAAINIPVAMWLLRPLFGDRATEQEEAATLEGASHVEILFGILLPMVLRGLLAASFLIFLMCWNEYLFAQYLASDRTMTLPPWLVGQVSYREAQIIAEEDEIVHLSAAIVLMALPLLALASGVQAALGRAALRRGL